MLCLTLMCSVAAFLETLCRRTLSLELFAEMKANDTTDAVSYNIVMKAFLRDGDLVEANRLMKEMSEQGFIADIWRPNEPIHTGQL